MDISKVLRQGDVHLIPDERPKDDPSVVSHGRTTANVVNPSKVRFLSRDQRRRDLQRRMSGAGARALEGPSGHGIILAAGEQTGHHHKVKEPRARLETKGNQLHLIVGSKGADLIHPEHGTISLPPGETFRVSPQREYTPPRTPASRASSRRVAD